MNQPSISRGLRRSLEELAKRDTDEGIKAKFTSDTQRVEDFCFDLGEFDLDLSKTHISRELVSVYNDFAKEVGFEEKRASFLSGEKINNSENRSVLHTLLRDQSNQGISMEDATTLEQADTAKKEFLNQYRHIQKQISLRALPIKSIIHVGIGGSSLGTQLVFEALKEVEETVQIHFIGNIDGHQLSHVLAQCEVNTTLVIGVSKTFSTAETLQNLNSIAQWFEHSGVANPISQFYGVTAVPEKAYAYGIPKDQVVSFPSWVGGRYSVWSSVSLSAVLVLGMNKFEEFLDGAKAIDRHFFQTCPTSNVCFLAAMLDHYYINFLNAQSRAIFAYDFRLRSLVDYLQQLETESNGKDRQRNGKAVDQRTSPVVWGGVGTDVQHSVFQMLHQGTSLIPAEFILVKTADHDRIDHHKELLANGIAQTAALLSGQTIEDVEKNHADDNLSAVAKQAKIFSGDRPSTTILLDRLTPKVLGAILAFYEHRTFCFGVLANINSYDQMGVELGKRLASQLRPMLNEVSDKRLKVAVQNNATGPQKSVDGLDPSTLNLLTKITKF